MDIVQAVSGYMTKMVSVGGSGGDDGKSGGASAGFGAGTGTASAAKMKILLLDSETVGWCHNQFLRLCCLWERDGGRVSLYSCDSQVHG